ncbi:UNVERIFIED_CONTAM: Replication protein A DNA-binding subunit C [Sesamum radiatum]|uniref:ATP-dependent DNA helicase n=1 Tax=Sesamum radiatum TaxID=300843 RepID=A0AAW2T6F3_SESRA
MSGNNRSLREFSSIPYPNVALLHEVRNALIAEELSYDRDALSNEHTQLYSGLNFQQKKVYDDVIRAVESNAGGLFFVYGSGGTGKTYLWKTIITRLRSQGKVVLAVASSGIASLLLPGGRTAHSKFKIPMIVDEDTTCRISQDIIGYTDPAAKQKVFGGKTIVLGGDFRQILPVVVRGGREDIVASSINRSKDIWQDCKVLELTTNMRLHHSSLDPTEVETMRNFGKWVLELGDGKLPAYNFDNEDEPSWIKIPDNLLIHNSGDPIMDVVSSTYPDLAFKKYRSSDRICPSENMVVDNQSLLYPIEFLNTLKFSGIPNHGIELKEVIEGQIITGSHVGERHFIHRIEMSPAESKWPFTFRRRQLPVKVLTLNHESWYNYVAQLSPERDGWKIKVRVTRMWDAINCNNGDLFSLDMILLDEHDDHIHASVHKNQAAKYRRQMHEGGIYLIQNFRICPRKRQYRPVHRDYMISFTYVTSVKCVNGEDEKFNKYKFDFVPYQDVSSFRGDLTYTYDVIGFLIKVGPIESIEKGPKNFKLREIFLKELSGHTMKVVLWGGHASQIGDDILCDGSCYLQTTPASRVYVNLDVQSVFDYLNTYKLTVEVKDFTGGAHFVIFDKEVEKLINCSASSLLEIFDKDGERCEQIVIQAFDQLRFCTFVFQVKVTRFNTVQGSKKFTVNRVINIDFKQESHHLCEKIKEFSQLHNKSICASSYSTPMTASKHLSSATIGSSSRNMGAPTA